MSSAPVARILLYVEDQIAIKATLVMALEDAGFHVLMADKDEQAFSVLAAQHRGFHG